MPLYEYTCQNCQHRFELLVGVGGRRVALKCPRCQSRNLRKEFSVFKARVSAGGSQSSTTASKCRTCGASSCESCSG